jgi:hypothetical protein
MPKITVTLRIVGIYLNKPYTVDAPATPTVRQIMDLIQAQDPDFRFTPGIVNNRETLLSASYYWGGRPQSTFKASRARGWYTLTDENSAETIPTKPNQVLTWQYYVGNPAEPPRTLDNVFIPFGEKDKRTVVKDKDQILWRLITVRTGPDVSPIA